MRPALLGPLFAAVLLLPLAVLPPPAAGDLNTLTYIGPPGGSGPSPPDPVRYYMTQRVGSQGTVVGGGLDGDTIQVRGVMTPTQAANLATLAFHLAACPLASASVVAGTPHVPTGASGASVTCSTPLAWTPFPGWFMMFPGVVFSNVVPVGSVVGPGIGHQVVLTCMVADVLDVVTGVTTIEEDGDFFVARDPLDPSLAWTTWASSTSMWANYEGNVAC